MIFSNGNVLMNFGKEKVRGVQETSLGEPEIRQVVLMGYLKHYLPQKWFLMGLISQRILIPKLIGEWIT
jgi:hypothetical protein